jgi:hypothetical protein
MKSLQAAALALAIATFAVGADAQTSPPTPTGHTMGPMSGTTMHHPMGGMMGHGPGQQTGWPTQPGQAAFGAIQEIVSGLQADRTTNWAKVDIDALRQHMIDMDEVTMRAAVQKEPIDHGLRMIVTGDGRTREAIQRMLPAHAEDTNGLYGWTVQAKALPNGEELTVIGANDADTTKIRALGFMGLMTLGTHQMHHLARAKGEFMHAH